LPHHQLYNFMSSRALRRAQKELEERQQEEALRQEDEEEGSEEDVAPTAKPRASLFALLNDVGDDENADEEDDEDVESEPEVPVAPAPKASQKSKKKKKKGKGKAKALEPETTPASAKAKPGLDEIDVALRALSLTSPAGKSSDTDQQAPAINEELQQLYSVLAVDTQHLHAANEMRKLFGRAAANDDQPARARRQPRGRGQQQAGVPGNQHLTSIVLRRNIFIQGKEEWPRATLGGLSMEVVEKRSDGSVEYRFMHNTSYQSVQREFEVCVASMDPERMIQLLALNRKLGRLFLLPKTMHTQ
jgi:hypothetical protein